MKPINVVNPSMPPFEEYIQTIKLLWQTKHLSNDGALHAELENKLTNYLGAKNTILFNNGHAALSCAIKALDLSGEVITTPYTFASTTHALVENGLTPVFCDIKESDFTIDPKKIENLITSKTSAILAVHVYGNICDVNEIDKIAKKHNLKAIYDAAHAFGVVKNDEYAANFGDISMFSFHATKVFHTAEGGCLTFNCNSLTEPLQRLKNFGLHKNSEEITYGTNAKMNELSAAMGICNLHYVDDYIQKRKEVYEAYHKNIQPVNGLRIFTAPEKPHTHNYSYMPILINEDVTGISRDHLHDVLFQNNIMARKYFHPLTSDFKVYKSKYPSNTQIARKIANSVLCLPMHTNLHHDDIVRISKIINSTLRRR